MSIKTFTINGNNFNDLSGFYDEVQRELTRDFRGFGRNLDAFNDILRGGFGKFGYDEHVRVIWKNSNKSRIDLGFPATVKYLEKQLSRVHPLNIESFKLKLNNAKNKEGPTLFDLLVEIIHSRDVDLVLE